MSKKEKVIYLAVLMMIVVMVIVDGRNMPMWLASMLAVPFIILSGGLVYDAVENWRNRHTQL